jgi:hypothetical protein
VLAQTYAEGCTSWLLCAPTGPGVPFGTPLVGVLDVVRVVVILGAFYAIGQCAAATVYIRNRRQRCIYGAVIALMLTIIGNEVDHFGDYAHYRLGLSLIAVVLACYGTYGIPQRIGDWDGPAPPGRDQRPPG